MFRRRSPIPKLIDLKIANFAQLFFDVGPNVREISSVILDSTSEPKSRTIDIISFVSYLR